MPSRENTKLVIVAAACLLVGAAAPATAAIVANADKVDGFHAVGFGSTITARKGKLVATSPTTGRLPNNIIATAPDSTRLGGFTHTQIRTLPLLAQGGRPIDGASVSAAGEMFLPVGGSAIWSFVLPPDYHAGDRISADFVFQHINGGPCAIVISASGESGPTATGAISTANHWKVTGDSEIGQVGFPSGAGLVGAKKTLSWLSSSTRAGQFVSLTVKHEGGTGDTCSSSSYVRAIQIRY